MNIVKNIQSFIAVVEAESFTLAAKRISVSTALISRYISQLESYLNVRLFNRDSRNLSLTTEGQIYYQSCTPLIMELSKLNSSLQERANTACGDLKITAPTLMTESLLMPLICDFTATYPDISINIISSNEVTNIIQSSFDLSIRSGELANSDLISRKLYIYDMVLCASFKYIEQNGQPTSLNDMHNHSLIIDTNLSDTWSFEIGNDIKSIKVDANIKTNCGSAIKTALLCHRGIAMIPKFAVANYIKNGDLVQVMPEVKIKKRTAFILYPSKRHLPAKITLFIDFLIKKLAPSS